MKNYLLILPIALLVTCSQLIVKWRSNRTEFLVSAAFLERLAIFLTDLTILSGYAAASLASFTWLYVVTQLPWTAALPVYIGITFVMVLFSAWFFLSETISITKIASIFLILCGIALGMSVDG